jgi:hypothetical protein
MATATHSFKPAQAARSAPANLQGGVRTEPLGFSVEPLLVTSYLSELVLRLGRAIKYVTTQSLRKSRERSFNAR